MIKSKLSIVIATHNRKKYLTKLLDQIKLQLLPENIDLYTIVIDDGSTDGTEEILKNNYPDVIYIRGTGNWWWTKCMNEGFKKAIHLNMDYVLILNDDSEIQQDFISVIWKDYLKLKNFSPVIIWAPSISLNDNVTIDSGGAIKFIKILCKFKTYYKDGEKLNEKFSGVIKGLPTSGRGLFIPVEIFNKIGFFDNKLPQYASDDDFILRAINNNIKIFITWNTRVYNLTNLTSKERNINNQKIRKFIKSFLNPYSSNSLRKFFYFYKKHSYKSLAIFYVIIMLCYSIIKFIIKNYMKPLKR